MPVSHNKAIGDAAPGAGWAAAAARPRQLRRLSHAAAPPPLRPPPLQPARRASPPGPPHLPADLPPPSTLPPPRRASTPRAGASPIKTVLRSKGFMWIANSHTTAFYWSHAGQHFEIRDEGEWCVAAAGASAGREAGGRGACVCGVCVCVGGGGGGVPACLPRAARARAKRGGWVGAWLAWSAACTGVGAPAAAAAGSGQPPAPCLLWGCGVRAWWCGGGLLPPMRPTAAGRAAACRVQVGRGAGERLAREQGAVGGHPGRL